MAPWRLLTTCVGAEQGAHERYTTGGVLISRDVPQISAVVHKHCGAGLTAALVTRNGEVVHSMAYAAGKVDSRTTLSLLSVTKQFTAMCAAMLIEEGKLELNVPVSRYLPTLNIPINGRELLVQDLVWHICGLPDFLNTSGMLSADRACIPPRRHLCPSPTVGGKGAKSGGLQQSVGTCVGMDPPCGLGRPLSVKMTKELLGNGRERLRCRRGPRIVGWDHPLPMAGALEVRGGGG